MTWAGTPIGTRRNDRERTADTVRSAGRQDATVRYFHPRKPGATLPLGMSVWGSVTVILTVTAWAMACLSAGWTVWVIRSPAVRVDFAGWVAQQLESPRVDEPAVRACEAAVAGFCFDLAPPLPVVRHALAGVAGLRSVAG